LEANTGTSARSSSRSTESVSYILRAIRDIDSHITTSNRRGEGVEQRPARGRWRAGWRRSRRAGCR
jgi:hypothetical protein